MVPILPQKPWEYAAVDYVGPLPCTASGNAYLLVFVDYFSKWIEVCAVREATAQVAAGKLKCLPDTVPQLTLSLTEVSPFVSELFENVTSTLGSVPNPHHCLPPSNKRKNWRTGHSKLSYVPTLGTNTRRGISFCPRSALHCVQSPMRAQSLHDAVWSGAGHPTLPHNTPFL